MFTPNEISPRDYGDFDGNNICFFFPPNEANYPTRITCKALVVALLRTRRGLWDAVVTNHPIAMLQLEARLFLANLLTYQTALALFTRLYEWASQNGLPQHLKVQSLLESNGWWAWLDPQIDWPWIAGRLKQELKDHKHRRGYRVDELLSDKPYERFEADAQEHGL